MRALTVVPGESNSIRLDELPAPPASDGVVLVRALALGICGTEISHRPSRISRW
jgi:threonine dehydrogenase-like Zn-dependent dehydrogenase